MKPFFGSRHGSAGVALIVVLWAVALISAAMLGLAAILQRQLGQELASLQNSRAVLAAECGIQMCLNPQVQPGMVATASRAVSAELQKGWEVPVQFLVRTEDLRGEEGRINLNALALGDRELCRRVLTNLLGLWDVNPTTSSAFIDGLLDYVDADSKTTGNNDQAEELAKNAPLERLEELEKIPGWDQVLREAKVTNWRDKFTIYGSGKLSLKSADEDVIEAWLGLSQGSATRFVQNRLGPDGIFGTVDDQLNLGLLPPLTPETEARTLTADTDLWRVTSTGQVGPVKRVVVALISRNPPQIKARWVEEPPQ